jgi:hypothetical protein
MLLYTLTKTFIEVQRNMLNAFDIKLFYKMVWWFDRQDISVEPTKGQNSIPFYQHILCGISYSYVYFLHVCKCIVCMWVVDR